MFPLTSPLTTTDPQLIVAESLAASPMMSRSGVLISPVKLPSIRSGPSKLSLPSTTEDGPAIAFMAESPTPCLGSRMDPSCQTRALKNVAGGRTLRASARGDTGPDRLGAGGRLPGQVEEVLHVGHAADPARAVEDLDDQAGVFDLAAKLDDAGARVHVDRVDRALWDARIAEELAHDLLR